MNIKNRIEKLEAKGSNGLTILKLRGGMTYDQAYEQALAEWRLETGKLNPEGLVIVLNDHCYPTTI